MAKQIDIETPVLPTDNLYKVNYGYVNNKGFLRNGAIVVKAPNADAARDKAKASLQDQYDVVKIVSVNNW